MDRVQVLIADPHNLSAEGMRRLLDGGSFNVVGVAHSLEDANRRIQKGLRPDLLMAALNDATPADQYAMIQQFRGGLPSLKVVVLVDGMSVSVLSQSILAGATGFLLRDISSEVLTRSLHLVMMDLTVFPPQAPMLLLEARARAQLPWSDGPAFEGQSSKRRLSDREGEILRRLIVGQSNKLIAREIGISAATVKAHLTSLMLKLEADNRTQAAVWGRAHGYLEKTAPNAGSSSDLAAAIGATQTNGSGPAGAHTVSKQTNGSGPASGGMPGIAFAVSNGGPTAPHEPEPGGFEASIADSRHTAHVHVVHDRADD